MDFNANNSAITENLLNDACSELHNIFEEDNLLKLFDVMQVPPNSYNYFSKTNSLIRIRNITLNSYKYIYKNDVSFMLRLLLSDISSLLRYDVISKIDNNILNENIVIENFDKLGLEFDKILFYRILKKKTARIYP